MLVRHLNVLDVLKRFVEFLAALEFLPPHCRVWYLIDEHLVPPLDARDGIELLYLDLREHRYFLRLFLLFLLHLRGH